MTVAARFEIHHSAFIAPDGAVLADLPPFARDRATLAGLYRWMVLTRAFDAKAVALQRTGRLGTYASSLGQEAVSVGLAHAMAPDDVLLPSFREHGAQLMRGVTMTELLLYWGGDERGSDFAAARHDFPVAIPIGSHAPHAAGVALALKLRGQARAALAVFGDGATSKGDVYEAMNLAGAWALPVVFVVSNNQWAISVPRQAQTAAQTRAQKAIAAGFEGLQVDGNDVVAVAAAVSDALHKARAGGGPTGRLRNRTRGRLSCPMVLRAPFGGGIHAPEHHSESMEALFAHIPGIRVVIPSSPARAYGLLLAAIRDPDPVIFLEPKRIYRALREPVVDDGQALPLDRAFVLRAGRDLTLVSWGAMLTETLAAAETLAAEGIAAEVIDIATLKLLDAPTILESVARTGRCVIVHEAPLTGGFGGEIAAQLAGEGLMHLLAPVERVTGWDTVMPLPRLEGDYMPSTARILAAARRALAFR